MLFRKKEKNTNAGRKQFDGKSFDLTIQKLCECWSLDCTDSEAASLAGISKAALSDFLKNHPDISEQKAALKEKPFLAARRAIITAINAGDAELALKYMERKKKDEFSTKAHVAHTGDCDLAELIRQARKRRYSNKANE